MNQLVVCYDSEPRKNCRFLSDQTPDTSIMSLLEEILSPDDDVLFWEEADFLVLTVSDKENKKRKRDDLEEGEIEEDSSVCSNGFFFDTYLMKKVPGCVECNSGKYCKRVRN